MNHLEFNLKPYQEPVPDIRIQGEVSRKEKVLAIAYRITGEIDRIRIPNFKDNAERQWGLWETTCLEFFLGVKNSPGYWEFNLSPSGEWNVFRLMGYRHGMEEERAIARLPFSVKREGNLFQLDLSLDLTPIIEPSSELELGITAVIESRQGEISYWALTHCGTEPDFHLRDSFIIAM